VDQKGLAKNFKNTEKIATHGVFHREASNRFLKSASVSYSNEASRELISKVGYDSKRRPAGYEPTLRVVAPSARV
jgi:hypothetical protein